MYLYTLYVLYMLLVCVGTNVYANVIHVLAIVLLQECISYILANKACGIQYLQCLRVSFFAELGEKHTRT